MKSATYRDLTLELRMSGGIPVPPPHAFMARTVANFSSLQICQLTAQIYLYKSIYLPHSSYMFRCATHHLQGGLLVFLKMACSTPKHYEECGKCVILSDVWLTVHRNSVWIRKTNKMSLFVFFISLLIVAQHVSGNHVRIIRS